MKIDLDGLIATLAELRRAMLAHSNWQAIPRQLRYHGPAAVYTAEQLLEDYKAKAEQLEQLAALVAERDQLRQALAELRATLDRFSPPPAEIRLCQDCGRPLPPGVELLHNACKGAP